MVLRADMLAARLKEMGIASPQQLAHARQELVSTQERFSAILTRQGILRDADAGKRLARQLGSLPQTLEPPAESPAAAGQVPPDVWATQRLVPFRERDGVILAATDDPFSVFAAEFLSSRCGRPIEAVLVAERDLAPLLATLTGTAAPQPAPAPPAPRIAAAPPPSTPMPRTISRTAPSRAGGAAGQPGADDEPIIQLVDSMFQEASRMRASDIHVEAGRDTVRVRYRIDGVLHDVNSPPKALHGPIVSRIKIMAGLNIAERRLPQDGRLQLTVGSKALDVRISTLPATHGESVVMRLLDRSQPVRGLAEMGLGADDQRAWEELVRRPHGMVLVTGPTGSGKTTTLYGALSMLNEPDRKLITVEDPVEYQLAGVNQVAVRSAIGLTFAAGLRSMLRQAPDVIMVGEIRDQETAQIAVQAALTGHLVLSTLHTNDAASAVTRLIDMGVAPFLVASTVQAVLAQRLVRRICSSCRVTDNASADERAFLGGGGVTQLIHGVGCEACHGSGFLGRIGIFELLIVTDTIRKLIVNKVSATLIRAEALRGGMLGLMEDGRAKVRDGLTTMSEVLRTVASAEE